jgi:beta-phosphoglucomutase-like phosphatase (HAD superfamily)
LKILSKPQSTIKAIVFDLDATLLDTEPNWYKADRALLSEYGIDFTEEMKRRYIGKSLGDMVNDLKEKFRIEADHEEIRRKKDSYYLDIAVGNTFLFPEMKLFFDEAVDRKFPIAIASGSSENVIETILKDIGIHQYFRFILTADRVRHGKPAPDIYIEAANRLRLNPKEILVLEDSVYGVVSAKDAGTNCVAIPYPPDDQLDEIYSRADLLFEKGMTEFDYKAVFEWMGVTIH